MEIQSSTTFSQDVRALTKADDKHANGPVGQQVSELAHAKNEAKAQLRLNAQLLEATVNTSFSASDNPTALVLKAAIEGINEALEETLGPNAIQEAYDSGLDVSPEATAERIVSLSTAFLGAYQEQNPSASIEDFIAVISGGIDQGFTEARDILEGLNVLEGEIATNIDLTYDLVQQGLDDFVNNFLTPEAEVEPEEETS